MASEGPSATPSENGAVLVHQRHDWAETAPTVAVALALGDITESGGKGPFDGVRPLAEYVDGDALDAMLRHEHGQPGSVRFTVGRLTVWIEGDELTISGPAAPAR